MNATTRRTQTVFVYIPQNSGLADLLRQWGWVRVTFEFATDNKLAWSIR